MARDGVRHTLTPAGDRVGQGLKKTHRPRVVECPIKINLFHNLSALCLTSREDECLAASSFTGKVSNC
jgi:hypothetical protein